MTAQKRTFILVAILVLALNADATFAQGTSDRSFSQYTCKDIMRESGAPREVTIAFMHGYLLGKTNAAKFNIETLLKQTDAFMDRCLDNPRENALETLSKIAN